MTTSPPTTRPPARWPSDTGPAFLRAESLPAARLALSDGATPLAGGVDLMETAHRAPARAPRELVSLRRVPGLHGIVRDGTDGLDIGAMTTLADVARSELVQARFPALARAAGEAATPQVRARATIAGNLLQRPRCAYFRHPDLTCLKHGGTRCLAREGAHEQHALFGGGPCWAVHPSSLAVPLVAAGATLRVAVGPSVEGRPPHHPTHGVALDTFFQTPAADPTREHTLPADGLVTAVHIASLPRRSAYVEIRHKRSYDWPLAACAVAQIADGRWRVVLGGVGTVPWRASASEQLLGDAGAPTEALIRDAANHATERAMPLPDSRWRLRLVPAVVRRALTRALAAELPNAR